MVDVTFTFKTHPDNCTKFVVGFRSRLLWYRGHQEPIRLLEIPTSPSLYMLLCVVYIQGNLENGPLKKNLLDARPINRFSDIVCTNSTCYRF